ncbi:MAG TPA: PAS domain-containing protein [Xanthobacteraceae bacterium]|nr:PAS domain-containing protein [Xanthobacteraceae bacterium]
MTMDLEFLTSRPDIVGSGRQRWLLSYWHRLRGSAALPAWRGLGDVAELDAMADYLGYAVIVGDEHDHRLLLTLQGARMAEAHGEYAVGKFLDEFLPSPYREASLATCRQTVRTKLPVYTVVDLRDHEQRIVHYERLLLPFGADGLHVDGILASIEATSPEGKFENRDLMNPPAKPPAFALCATILHELSGQSQD